MLATTQNLHDLKNSNGEKMMDKHKPYTERLKLRMTVEEKQELQAKAAKANMTVSKYIRALINNKKIVVAPDLPKLVVQTIKIGVNVNQILNVAKASGTISQEKIAEIEKQYTDIQNLTGDLIREVYYRKDRNRYKI
jgi:predicted DNA binding CopG/RHH family protein